MTWTILTLCSRLLRYYMYVLYRIMTWTILTLCARSVQTWFREVREIIHTKYQELVEIVHIQITCWSSCNYEFTDEMYVY